MDSHGTSRRELLTAGARSAVAFAIPAIVPASALGLGRRLPPSERIVMGSIGVGGQGTQHVVGGIWTPSGGLVGRDDVQYVAACDVNARNLENARTLVNQRYGNQDCKTYRDFRELLARPDIDAVLIATGERWHPYISIAAAKAGKDVYCEKPMSVTIREAQAVREAVRRHGIVYQNGTQQRSSRAFRYACELVRNGCIGKLTEVIVACGGPPTQPDCHLPAEPVPDWLDYDMWLGPAPWRPFNSSYVFGWMAWRDFSGGEMTNWGAHHFDIAQWGIGADDTGPLEIVPPNGKDVGVGEYRFAGGVTMTRDPDRMGRESGSGNGVVFIGTKGKVAVWRYDLRTWPDDLAQRRIKPDEVRLHAAENHHTDFLDAVRTRSKPGANADVGARSITLSHLGNIAYELNRPVRWDPVKERFVGDPDADRLMARRTRPPWSL
ncbi:MAG: Gfo/Idh/MocA family oxidoreductase [Armatimonadetes bacterium]|nr:Gfo/Idh/MocA family oxidoreductase [Armatimonadota bacterium]